MSDIKLKILTKNDNLQYIVHLFNTLYPQRPIKKDYIFWRYLNNPYECITYIAKDADKIIGSYSGCVFEGFINNKRSKIGFLYDLMIHPQYQNRGLVLPLYKAVLNFITKKKPGVLYGFVNKNSLPLYTKYFKWQSLKKVPFYFNNTKRLKAMLNKGNLDLNKITFQTKLSKEISDLTSRALREENIRTFVYRSQKMLAWRSKRVFGKDFRLFIFKKEEKTIGFCLLKFFEDKTKKQIIVDIIDVISYPKSYLSHIIYMICNIIEKSGTKNIATFGFGQTGKEDLKKLGFEKSNSRWNLIVSNVVSRIQSDFYVNMLDTEMF